MIYQVDEDYVLSHRVTAGVPRTKPRLPLSHLAEHTLPSFFRLHRCNIMADSAKAQSAPPPAPPEAQSPAEEPAAAAAAAAAAPEPQSTYTTSATYQGEGYISVDDDLVRLWKPLRYTQLTNQWESIA